MRSQSRRQPVTMIVRALEALEEPAATALASSCWQRLEPHHSHEHYEAAEAAAVAIVDKLRLVDPDPALWSGVVVWWGGATPCTQVGPGHDAMRSPPGDPWWDAVAVEREWLWCELVEVSGLPRELGHIAGSLVSEVLGGWDEVRDLLGRMSTEPPHDA